MAPQTSTQANLALVQSIYDAYAARNVDGMLAALHDDVEVFTPEALPWGGTYKGRDGMLQFIQAISSHVASIVVVENLYESGDRVVMVGRSKGTVNATDESYEVGLVDVCRIQDGKIVRLDILIDTPAILQLLPS